MSGFFSPLDKCNYLKLDSMLGSSDALSRSLGLLFDTRQSKGATINGVTYEEVAEFIYLCTLISNDNSVEKKIQRRILAGNRTYFAAISLFRKRFLFRATKIVLYKTLIRPIVAYGAETWTMTKKEEQTLLIFERKIFRRIYGAKY
jgi:hypothetical protein